MIENLVGIVMFGYYCFIYYASNLVYFLSNFEKEFLTIWKNELHYYIFCSQLSNFSVEETHFQFCQTKL